MMVLRPNLPIKAVLFDLDNTLFDHHHSLRSAISAVRRKFPALSGFNIEKLIGTYDASLQQAYDEYLDKKITYEEADVRKIKLFFKKLGLPKPSIEEITEFRHIYKPVYRENRRATPGSIETLTRLRAHGYRIAIVTNGQIQYQEAKADAIGIRHLADRIITSEEAGCRKPNPRIFHSAMEALGAALDATLMVGDSADSDIKGALDTGLCAIMYSPAAQDSCRLLFGREVPIICHINQLLDHLGIILP